jgi:ABC-type Fe3+ transport system permease subunit
MLIVYWCQYFLKGIKMLNFLKLTLKAGCVLPSIAAALLYSINQQWMTISVFSTLTSEQTYNAYIYSLGIAFACFVLLIIVYSSSKNSSKTITASGNGNAIDSSGTNSPVTIHKK